MKKHDTLLILAYAYVLLPLIIFLLGWTKFFVIGVPLSVAIIICYINLIKTTTGCSKIAYEGSLVKKILTMIFIVIIISIWVYFSGIGGYSYQNSDHDWRNEIFRILVDYRWPVRKESIVGERGLSYYIGFWMLPAVVGKIWGIDAGFLAQLIWAIVGLLLVYQFICRRLNKLAIVPLLIFVFFSGLDIIGWILEGNLSTIGFNFGISIDGWKRGYQYSSMTTQLYWVFNQAIYAWLITLIILEEKNRRMLLLFAAGIFTATLPMIGALPIILFQGLKNTSVEQKDKEIGFLRAVIKSSVTYENTVGLICSAIIMSLFLGNVLEMISLRLILIIISIIIVLSLIIFISYILIRKRNMHFNKICKMNFIKFKQVKIALGGIVIVAWCVIVEKISSIGNAMVANNNLITYTEFLLVEIGCLVLLCKNTIKQSKLYVLAVVILLICPVIVIGSSADFCMRASIPSLLILYLAVVENLYVQMKNKTRIKLVLLIIILVMGSVTPASEIYRSYQNRDNPIIDYVSTNRIFERPNFSVDASGSLFYKYIAAK